MSIPNPDFLHSYYSGIDRTRHEDYSVYVFDLFDEGYIELLVDKLMYDLNIENNVDKINFAASFVQNLEYKRDSETNESLEYPYYPIETLDDAITLLTGVEAGRRDERGEYPAGSINQRVQARLLELFELRQKHSLARTGDQENE